MNDHEADFLAFIEDPQRRRVRTLFELGAKRRPDLVAILHHKIRLDCRLCQPIPGGSLSAPAVAARLRELGAPAHCHVIGGGLDGRDAPLADTLWDLIGFGDGAFVSCVSGRLGYYQYEEPNHAYLCRK